ncbi:MAG: hypothetical protein J7K66_03225 [Anaerolineaceae bacterium]|nr:hypothetical protein [Anaerolineaceae bacterium]
MLLNNLLIIIALAAVGLMIAARDWRMRIAGLASLYLVGFIVILQIWPVALASVKLISGWMGVALLSTSMLNSMDQVSGSRYTSEMIFRLLMVILIWIVVAAVAPSINAWIPIPYTNLYIGFALLGSGVLFMSLTDDFFEVILGLLMVLIGFDIIYSSVEGSALVTGIYAFIIILICLLGTYFSPVVSDRENA